MLAVGYVRPEMIFVMSLNSISLPQIYLTNFHYKSIGKEIIELHIVVTQKTHPYNIWQYQASYKWNSIQLVNQNLTFTGLGLLGFYSLLRFSHVKSFGACWFLRSCIFSISVFLHINYIGKI